MQKSVDARRLPLGNASASLGQLGRRRPRRGCLRCLALAAACRQAASANNAGHRSAVAYADEREPDDRDEADMRMSPQAQQIRRSGSLSLRKAVLAGGRKHMRRRAVARGGDAIVSRMRRRSLPRLCPNQQRAEGGRRARVDSRVERSPCRAHNGVGRARPGSPETNSCEIGGQQEPAAAAASRSYRRQIWSGATSAPLSTSTPLCIGEQGPTRGCPSTATATGRASCSGRRAEQDHDGLRDGCSAYS